MTQTRDQNSERKLPLTQNSILKLPRMWYIKIHMQSLREFTSNAFFQEVTKRYVLPKQGIKPRMRKIGDPKKKKKKKRKGSSHHGTAETPLGTMRLWVQSLASLSGFRIRHCGELWWRLQTRLGSCIAVAVVWAGNCSSDWTRSLGISKKPKQTNKQNRKGKEEQQCV